MEQILARGRVEKDVHGPGNAQLAKKKKEKSIKSESRQRESSTASGLELCAFSSPYLSVNFIPPSKVAGNLKVIRMRLLDP